jgi:hypothetical protein
MQGESLQEPITEEKVFKSQSRRRKSSRANHGGESLQEPITEEKRPDDYRVAAIVREEVALALQRARKHLRVKNIQSPSYLYNKIKGSSKR